jgi:DNA processing protein
MHVISRFIPSDAAQFPRWLAEIQNPPRGIFISGPPPAPDALALAVVGTRRASPDGKALARDFARTLGRRGILIVSGLAFGIDAAAHEGALDADGQTIAVLPCGLDRIYPPSNEKLAAKILHCGGALVSEYPPGTEPLPFRFLERNRIVSGLARGVIVVEAPENSGALVTARLAAEQGRDCFVVPGPAHHPNFVGSHQLIRKGAELVTTPEEIMEAYGLRENTGKTGEMLLKRNDLTGDERRILAFLFFFFFMTDIDKIITNANVEPQAANVAIGFLLVKGLVKETAGGYIIT